MKLLTCPCGTEFQTKPCHIRSGRAKYCSRTCRAKYQAHPPHSHHVIKVTNKAWFIKGQTSLQKGKESPLKKEHPGYEALHEWVERWAGKPKKCEFCGIIDQKVYHWSNKSGQYKRDLADWQRLCVKCHCRYDYENFGARKAFYT